MAQFSLAGETSFQNNLLKMDVSKSSQGNVKMTLYTTKPYKDSVLVNKKGENQYVILLPETANSLTSKPSLKTASDIVQNIDVKTQQYGQNGQKGYTKIVISTSKPVEIAPSVKTLQGTTYQLSETEYKELLARSAKGTSKPEIRPKQTVKTTSSTQENKKTTGQKTSAGTQKQTTGKEQIKKVATVAQVKKNEATFKPKAGQNIAKAPEKKETPIKKPLVKEIEKKQPHERAEKTVKPVINPAGEKEETKLTELKTETPQGQNIAPITKTDEKTLEPPVKIRKLTKIKNKIKEIFGGNVYLAAGTALIPILLLILIIRLLKKSSKKQKKVVAEPPISSTKDLMQALDSEDDVKPTFEPYPETAQIEEEFEISTAEPTENMTESEELDSLFGIKNEDLDLTEEEIQDYEGFPETIDTAKEDEIASFDFADATFKEEQPEEEFSIEELLGEDSEIEESEEKIEPAEEVIEEEQESGNILLSEFSLGQDRGFYLVDYEGETALVGQINEDVFVLKRFEYKISGKIQARLNERKGSAGIYLVKVGGFKALVEVDANSMKLLLEF